MEKINIAEILKDCPKGMELDCAMYEQLTFVGIELEASNYPIVTQLPNGIKILFTKYGEYDIAPQAKCVIFPKGKTTWEGFVPPCQFKAGDILFVDCSDDCEDEQYKYIFILKEINHGAIHSYCHIFGKKEFHTTIAYLTDNKYPIRLATEEEKQKLFDVIKANGYKWNAETKTLEKLIVPKFKVGDRIKSKTLELGINIITKVCENYYELDDGCTLGLDNQDCWELIPNKFDISTLKPFDKILVRHNSYDTWEINFFGYHDEQGVHTINKCTYTRYIPFSNNEHLLGTTNDCDEYYKIWEL